MFDQRSNPRGEGNHAPLALVAIRPTFAVDGDAVRLPVDVVFAQPAELGDPEPGVEERPDNELFEVALTDVGEPVGVVSAEGLSFVLIRHVVIGRGLRQDDAIGENPQFVNTREIEIGGLRVSLFLTEGDNQSVCLIYHITRNSEIEEYR